MVKKSAEVTHARCLTADEVLNIGSRASITKEKYEEAAAKKAGKVDRERKGQERDEEHQRQKQVQKFLKQNEKEQKRKITNSAIKKMLRVKMLSPKTNQKQFDHMQWNYIVATERGFMGMVMMMRRTGGSV